MTTAQQTRIALAEFLGWKRDRHTFDDSTIYTLDEEWVYPDELPDLASLVPLVRARLNREQKINFVTNLCDLLRIVSLDTNIEAFALVDSSNKLQATALCAALGMSVVDEK